MQIASYNLKSWIMIKIKSFVHKLFGYDKISAVTQSIW